MQFVFEDGAHRVDVDVVVHDPDALVADLARALAGPDSGAGHLVVDGCAVPADRRLDRAGIMDGALVRLDHCAGEGSDRAGDRPSPGPPVVVLEVVGGIHAGTRWPLGRGRWSIGREGADVVIADPTISSVHATVDVSPQGAVSFADQRSFNGSWQAEEVVAAPTVLGLQDIVRVGATHLRFAPPHKEDQPGAGDTGRRFAAHGTRPFNRPPRAIPPTTHEPLAPPRPPREGGAIGAVGLVSVIAPLVLGLVMVKVFHNWLYAMFALLSPVMVIGNAFESRRRDRRTSRADRARFTRDLCTFRGALAERASTERERRLERLPSPAEITRRAVGGSSRLWERRPHHPDFLVLSAGLGDVRWEPPVDAVHHALDADVRQATEDQSTLRCTPVVVDLSAGGVVGIFGPQAAARPLARSLVAQVATLHGPADVPITVLTTAASAPAPGWDWTKWLPHTQDRSASGRTLTADPDAADQLLRSFLADAPQAASSADGRDHGVRREGPTRLVVIDDPTLTEGRRSPARSVLRGLAGPVAGIVICPSEDQLPASCTAVIEVTGPYGEAVLHHTDDGRHTPVLLGGMADATVRSIALALARFDDPELDVAGARLPTDVDLLPLLGLDLPLPDAAQQRWDTAGPDPELVVPIGVGDDGVLALDLVRDGPHGLVAGTTGSGKSELLRTLVVGLAVACPPSRLTFVLIDFKGGSAFDECAKLPHTVGMVTDLDERLGARALRCLEAELRHRERILRAAGVADLAAHRRLGGGGPPVPRLVVVIDEFATLKHELPDFVDALVGIAQRGRSLGVHLVLATQRPSGAVSENIRANANLRIALRVQDPNDSRDVIDVPDAALISRAQPGRAFIRLGPGEVVAVQTALSTGRSTAAGHAPVEVRPFPFAGRCDSDCTAPAGERSPTDERTPSDLSRLVDALGAAFRRTGASAPRRPWPDPLPERVALDSLLEDRPRGRFGEAGAAVPFALADLPDEQVQRPTGWMPADGNLLLIGVGGSGTTTALSSIALSATATTGPDDLHLYVVDFGAGDLAPLGRLPHTGAVITASERERQARLIRHLKAELARRRALAGARETEPRILVLLDGISAYRAAWDDADPTGMLDDLIQVFADGSEVGVHLALTADRPGAIPNGISGVAGQRLVFRLGEPLDYAMLGLSARDAPPSSPGGAVIAGPGTEVRVGVPGPDLATAVARVGRSWAGRTARPPAAVGFLPSQVHLADVAPAARMGVGPWFVTIGIGEIGLAPVGLTLYPGDHALIAGPARSGRTTALRTIACVVRAARPTTTIVALAGPRSSLGQVTALDDVLAPGADAASLHALGGRSGPVLILVDDADLVADEGDGLREIIGRRRPDLHVVAAGNAESLRSLYTHWTRAVRGSRCGALLQPDADLDGDLLGTRLPRRAPVAFTAGRGYLVNGSDLEALQLAE